MRVLGIDSATAIASVGVVGEDGVVSERSLPMAGSHARTLLPLIDDTLSAAGWRLARLDLLAVSIGPGSFTGLRVGLSVAKGLALATGLPVVGVPTLDAFARAVGPRPGLICPVLDARKGEVYAAAFACRDGRLERLHGPVAVVPDAFAAQLAVPCTLLGDGVDAYAAVWRSRLGSRAELVSFSSLSPRGGVVAQLGAALAQARGPDDLAKLEPTYCRPPEAEMHRERRMPHAVAERGKIDSGWSVG